MVETANANRHQVQIKCECNVGVFIRIRSLCKNDGPHIFIRSMKSLRCNKSFKSAPRDDEEPKRTTTTKKAHTREHIQSVQSHFPRKCVLCTYAIGHIQNAP